MFWKFQIHSDWNCFTNYEAINNFQLYLDTIFWYKIWFLVNFMYKSIFKFETLLIAKDKQKSSPVSNCLNLKFSKQTWNFFSLLCRLPERLSTMVIKRHFGYFFDCPTFYSNLLNFCLDAFHMILQKENILWDNFNKLS